MDRFEDLTTFVAVAEAGSFTAAAERLGIAKSAVSRRVAGLEERLGAQLLHRTTRKISLTDSGSAFYERARRLLADLEEAESAVAQAHGELRGQLRVAIPLAFGLRHMSRPICEFNRRHPKIVFDLDLNDRRVDLVEEGMDLAVRIGQLRDSTLIARKLFDVRTIVCASPGYLQAHGVPETPEELADHSCLVYSNLPEPRRWGYVDADGERRYVQVGPGLSASNGEFVARAAAADLGIVMNPTFIVHDLIESGALVPILTGYRWPVTPGFAVYPPTRHLSYRVRAFIDFLVEWFSGPTSWDVACGASGASCGE
ncbi:MAG: LysR family transcriptional regulator [Woeseiaceae bacterium]|nr:LysR family transcriptional regulator [Woeseiaceae bacterium]